MKPHKSNSSRENVQKPTFGFVLRDKAFRFGQQLVLELNDEDLNGRLRQLKFEKMVNKIINPIWKYSMIGVGLGEVQVLFGALVFFGQFLEGVGHIVKDTIVAEHLNRRD